MKECTLRLTELRGLALRVICGEDVQMADAELEEFLTLEAERRAAEQERAAICRIERLAAREERRRAAMDAEEGAR